MERFFILDKFNTWYDWRLIVTAKDIPSAEPKTNYVELDGMNGTLDLSEALTGEIAYRDRVITATFFTDNGTREDRERLLRNITSTIHGKKIKIVEPDDLTHYFIGRATITGKVNNLAYAEIMISFVCEPWRYAIEDTTRYVEANPILTDVILNNNGVKTVSPIITVTGNVDIHYNGVKTSLTDGSYKISDIKLRQGVNIIGVSGNGSATFTYKEADL